MSGEIVPVLQAIIPLGLGLMSWVYAGVQFRRWRKALGKTATMRRTDTSLAAQISGAPPGTPVEVSGELRCEEPLRSEMSGQTCAYYRSQVIRVQP